MELNLVVFIILGATTVVVGHSNRPPMVPPKQVHHAKPAQQQHQPPSPQQHHQNTETAQLNDPNAAKPDIPSSHPSVFRDRNHIQDKDHIMDHLDGVINKPTEEMTDDELQFHYFKLHDADNNNMLDGLELMKAVSHFHKEEDPANDNLSDDQFSQLVDTILEEDDFNKDGYVDYTEFISAQRENAQEPAQENVEV